MKSTSCSTCKFALPDCIKRFGKCSYKVRASVSKLKNVKIEIDGHVFDSKLESDYYLALKEKESAGHIENLKIHPRYELLPKYTYCGKKVRAMYYEADFEFEAGGTVFVIDIKGFALKDSLIKRKLFEFYHLDKQLSWIAFSKMDGGWIDYDQLKKNRSERKKAKAVKNGK